jgi:hypothetical protein
MLQSDALTELVTASRCPTLASQVQQQLSAVVETAEELLQSLQQRSGSNEQEHAARQHDLLLCFRVVRNAAATGGTPACAALLHLGLMRLVCTALQLVSTATISLNWQLPAAISQALANLCNACGTSAAAAWDALFPLHFSMLAHVNAGENK